MRRTLIAWLLAAALSPCALAVIGYAIETVTEMQEEEAGK